MKKLLLICGLLASGFSFGTEWTYISTAKSGDLFYIDTSQYKYDNKLQSIDVWVKVESKTGVNAGLAKILGTDPNEQLYTRSKNLVRYSCLNKTSKTLAAVNYSESGGVLSSTTRASGDFSVIFPDSVDEILWTSSCLSKGKGYSLPEYKPEYTDLRKLGYKE